MDSSTEERDFQRLSRRSLLKLTPVVLVGAFAIPKLRDSLLNKGLAFSDWASSKWFRAGHLAPMYPDSELTPLTQFPLNSYDVDDPEIDLGNLNLFRLARIGCCVCRPTSFNPRGGKARSRPRRCLLI